MPTLRNSQGWLCLSLAVPLYYGLLTLTYVYSQPDIVQDDARQHIVWFQQFSDPQLFRNDWIARYFLTVAPLGYKGLYWGMAQVGVEPLTLARWLPLVLALIATGYLFFGVLQILPMPLAAFITTLVFNQQIWLNDDLVSATPRAFVYPLLAAFLYYLLRRSLFPLLLVIGLQGLFFPQMVLLEVAILTVRLVRWRGRSCAPWPLSLSQEPQDYRLWLGGMAVGLIVLLPFALNLSQFGAAIAASQMRQMPEYGLGGRSQYFGVDGFNFWFNGPSGLRLPLFPSVILVGLALPWLRRSRRPCIAHIALQITPQIDLLLHTLIASLGLFGLAHLFLLKLHFPNRYTYHSLRFILAIATGIVLTALLHWGWQGWKARRSRPVRSRGDRVLAGLAAMGLAILVAVPAIPWLFLPFQGWVVGQNPLLYRYLAAQPADSIIASLSDEANNIPAFARRTVLAGREFALPHHPRYYQTLQQRTVDIIHAQYGLDRTLLKQVIERQGIDFWLLDRDAFQPEYLQRPDWLIHSSFQATVRDAIHTLEDGQKPVLQSYLKQCAVLSTDRLTLLKTACILASLSEQERAIASSPNTRADNSPGARFDRSLDSHVENAV
ncbi:MAG TPA: hypothetical protein V6C88_04870 [Chroococcidiopsis sp.]